MIRLGRRWPQHVQRNGHSKYANPKVKSIAAACTNALERAGTCISSRQQELQYLRSFANMVDRPLTRRESLERVASDMVAVALFFGAHNDVVNDRRCEPSTCPLSFTALSIYQLKTHRESSQSAPTHAPNPVASFA